MSPHSPLQGKKALIFGVANERSLAWAIATSLHRQGVSVGLTYQNETLEKRSRPLADSIGVPLFGPCDIQNPEQVQAVFRRVEQEWGGLDILVHSLAYAERKDLEGRFVDTSREGFRIALETGAYSLVELARLAEPLMHQGGSIVTLSYLGAQRVVANYNVMGVAKAALEASVRYLANDLGPKKIRVNAISAGPVKTLAAAGIHDFRSILGKTEAQAPLRENIDQQDVGELAAFLCGDFAKHITGTTLFVDSGMHILA